MTMASTLKTVSTMCSGQSGIFMRSPSPFYEWKVSVAHDFYQAESDRVPVGQRHCPAIQVSRYARFYDSDRSEIVNYFEQTRKAAVGRTAFRGAAVRITRSLPGVALRPIKTPARSICAVSQCFPSIFLQRNVPHEQSKSAPCFSVA